MPPIFVFDGNDASAFPTLAAAEWFLEPPDVESGTNRLFDASGLVLRATVERALGLFPTPETRITSAKPLRRSPTELATHARDFLHAVAARHPDNRLDSIDDLELDELLRLLFEYAEVE